MRPSGSAAALILRPPVFEFMREASWLPTHLLPFLPTILWNAASRNLRFAQCSDTRTFSAAAGSAIVVTRAANNRNPRTSAELKYYPVGMNDHGMGCLSSTMVLDTDRPGMPGSGRVRAHAVTR